MRADGRARGRELCADPSMGARSAHVDVQQGQSTHHPFNKRRSVCLLLCVGCTVNAMQ